jgi:hypothetical protein
MSTQLTKLKHLNIKQTQFHPFHVLTSSKLPIFIATFTGFLALSFISKLHGLDYIASSNVGFVLLQLLEPFFFVSNLNHLSINVVILVLIILLLIAMGS